MDSNNKKVEGYQVYVAAWSPTILEGSRKARCISDLMSNILGMWLFTETYLHPVQDYLYVQHPYLFLNWAKTCHETALDSKSSC